jgi:Tfp pilus assembly protein PilP
MTNQNPAVPQPNSSKLDRDILAKVNAHADRSMDRLFADLDELLSGDLEHDSHSSTSSRTEPVLQQQQQYQPPTYPAQSQFAPPQSSKVELEQPSPTAKPKQKKGLPLWLKALLGIGATSIAVGGGLLWAINERKIELPKNIDTSWLPFQPKVSPEDAKFADYMRKSIAKIDANMSTTSATNPVNLAPTQSAPIAAQAEPIVTTPTGTTTTVTATATPTAVKNSIELVKTIPNGNRPGAIFQIDRQSKTVNVGQKIGASDWSLLTVAKGEVILKRKGGEIRSIYVGQKF